MDPINWKMIGHPINWIIVMLMLIIAGAIGHETMSLFGIEPKTKRFSSTPSNGLVNGQSVVGGISQQSAS